VIGGREHVGEPADDANIPVDLEHARGLHGWVFPEIQDGLHAIDLFLSQPTVEEI
jgi:hypothetical protein